MDHSANFKDIIGQRFTHLIVVSYSHTQNGKIAWWNCICDCGNKTIVRGKDLRRNTTRSCGCYKIEQTKRYNSLEPGEAGFNVLFKRYLKDCKKKKRNFELTKEEFKNLTKKCCFYCGKQPYRVIQPLHISTAYIYNGIDRIDSNKDYTVNNVVSCCKDCNLMKNNLDIYEFIQQITLIYNNRETILKIKS